MVGKSVCAPTGSRHGPGARQRSTAVAVSFSSDCPADPKGEIRFNSSVGYAAALSDSPMHQWGTVWPTGPTRPTVSNLNPAAGQTAPNAVVTLISAANEFNIYDSAGTVHVLVDVVGACWLYSGTASGPGAQGLLSRSRTGPSAVYVMPPRHLA